HHQRDHALSPRGLAGIVRGRAAGGARRVPGYEAEYARRGWKMFPRIGRVYVNRRARDELGWQPRYDFRFVLDRLAAGEALRSPLARAIGSKGYHAGAFPDVRYPVE